MSGGAAWTDDDTAATAARSAQEMVEGLVMGAATGPQIAAGRD